MTLDPYLIPHIKVNFRWVVDFNMKNKTIKLTEENIKEYLPALRVDNDFEKAHKSLRNHQIQKALIMQKRLAKID